MLRTRVIECSLLLVLASLTLGGVARAQSKPDLDAGSDQPRPWADGVPKKEQEAAKKLFDEGNDFLADSLFVKAATKYREALRHWDHPAIHYNLALALMNLEQPLQVYQALQKAMRHGPAPLDMDKFERARSYKQLVEKQLAHVEVVCDEPGAKVAMDGKLLFTGPGRYAGLVLIGEHSFTADKAGYIPINDTRVLEPGETEQVTLTLYTLEDRSYYVRRWSPWKPWTVAAGGAALGIVGGAVHALALQNFRDFDALVKEQCQEGCPDLDTSQRDRARLQQNVAIGSYVVGGTLVVTGFVLVYLNQPRKMVRMIDQTERDDRVSLTPILTPHAAGVVAKLRF